MLSLRLFLLSNFTSLHDQANQNDTHPRGIVNLTNIVDELSPLICYLSGEKGEIEQRSIG
jgi:hypothetical protein